LAPLGIALQPIEQALEHILAGGCSKGAARSASMASLGEALAEKAET
jgi:hypothetical protein